MFTCFAAFHTISQIIYGPFPIMSTFPSTHSLLHGISHYLSLHILAFHPHFVAFCTHFMVFCDNFPPFLDISQLSPIISQPFSIFLSPQDYFPNIHMFLSVSLLVPTLLLPFHSILSILYLLFRAFQ